MNEKPKIKWRWRILRWSLIGLAVLITLVAIAVTEEDWRGKRAWEDYKCAAAANGDLIDPAEQPAADIPDDQNFARASIFDALLHLAWDEKSQQFVRDPNYVDRLQMRLERSTGDRPAVFGDWRRSTVTDLKVWQNYYRNARIKGTNEFPVSPQPQAPAADVLLALSTYTPVIDELRQASRRSYTRFSSGDPADAQSSARLLNYLGDLKSCFQVTQLRTLAEVADGQTVPAYEDMSLLLRLDEKLAQERFLISHLVAMAMMSVTIQPLYEGLARHQWNDAQLADLQQQLAALDCLALFQKSMRDERSFAIQTLEGMRRTHEYLEPDNSSDGAGVTTIHLWLTPAAFYYQNELTAARLCDQYELPLVDVTNRLAFPAAVRRAEADALAERKGLWSYYKMTALIAYPAMIKSVERFATEQANLDLARVACALERYRLAHGEYPETLAVLAPQFIDQLPHDIINGQPLHYHRTDDGLFVLYSVGWNEKDDGGLVVLTKKGIVDREKGDWVWRYPAP